MQTNLKSLYKATDFDGIPTLVNRIHISSLKIFKEELSKPVLKEFEDQLIERKVTIRIDNIPNVNNLDIIPCSIRPEHLPCDFTDWLAQKSLGYCMDLSTDNKKILYV